MEGKIDITLDKDTIESMSSDERVGILLNLAFANRASIDRMELLMIGDGDKEGLCDTVRSTKKSMTWLWSIFCAVSGAYFTLLVYHISK